MEAAGWVMLVALAMSNGGGYGVLYDKATGQPPVFDTRAECETELAKITTQVVGKPEIDLTKSTLKCEPVKAK